MRIPENAFSISPNNIQNKIFSLCEKESHHALKVLRLKKGDTVILLDGKSQGYFGVIDQIKPKFLTGTIKKTIKNFGENQNAVHISPGLLKKNRFEILLEKATELGVKEIHPIIMERSVKTKINIDRCNKILVSAAKQCRRSFFPILHQPKDLQTLFNINEGCKYYACHLNANFTLFNYKSALKYPSNLIIGPEGGFSETELDIMKNRGVLFFHLGNRRLRAETAALSSITLFNELGM
tara:strand:- start:772 stop:1485 length:714 start_codon:yes stop_codon:yes gene_type:complete